MPSVLFVCYANYCRSPMAEAAMRLILDEAGAASEWRVDSAGISDWHAGKSPDPRGQKAISKKGMKTSHIGRQIDDEDFSSFDHIFCMDDGNLRMLERMAGPQYRAKIHMIGEYDPNGEVVTSDCYYGEQSDFDRILEKCIQCCRNFYHTVTKMDVSS